MSALTSEPPPRLRPDARYRLVGGQAVVVVQEAGEALVLNEVGSRILELVDGRRRIAEIVATMREEYDVSAAELERDVRHHLDELAEAGVLETPAGDLEP